MTNHPNRSGEFELTFWGGVPKAEVDPDFKWRRMHKTLDQAKAEARRVHKEMSNANAHPAVIYGPGLGRDGLTV